MSTGDDRKLGKLAREGREELARKDVEARTAAEARAAGIRVDDEDAPDNLGQMRAVSGATTFAFKCSCSRTWDMSLAIVAILGSSLIYMLVWEHLPAKAWAVIGGALVVLGILYLIVMLTAVPRERRWLRALPFALVGYEEALGMQPKAHTYVTLKIAWAGAAAPPLEHLLEIFAADGAKWTRTDAFCYRRDEAIKNPAPIAANRQLRAWLRGLVERQLRPLHGSHHFESVEIAVAYVPATFEEKTKAYFG